MGNLIGNEDEPKLLMVLNELVWLIKWNAGEWIQIWNTMKTRIYEVWIKKNGIELSINWVEINLNWL